MASEVFSVSDVLWQGSPQYLLMKLKDYLKINYVEG